MRGECDIGRVHAENAIRSHNQNLKLLSLGARLQGAANVLQAAVRQNRVCEVLNVQKYPIARGVKNSFYGYFMFRQFGFRRFFYTIKISRLN